MASSVVVVIGGSVRIDTERAPAIRLFPIPKETRNTRYPNSPNDDDGREESVYDTHSQKLCHFSLFRVHGQINSGADTEGDGYQQGDKYEIDRVEQLVSDASFSREANISGFAPMRPPMMTLPAKPIRRAKKKIATR